MFKRIELESKNYEELVNTFLNVVNVNDCETVYFFNDEIKERLQEMREELDTFFSEHTIKQEGDIVFVDDTELLQHINSCIDFLEKMHKDYEEKKGIEILYSYYKNYNEHQIEELNKENLIDELSEVNLETDQIC